MDALEALSRLVSTGRSLRYGLPPRRSGGLRIDPEVSRALGLLVSRPKAEYGLAPRGINRVARAPKARAAAREALSLSATAWSRARRAPAAIAAALSCDDLGRPAEAARWWARAAGLEPKEGWLRLARADALRRSGDLRGFVREAAKAHYLDEGAGVFRFGVVEPKKDAPRAAIAGATRLLRRQPRAAWALALRGDLKRFPEVNDFTGALADFEAAARLAPREAWIFAYLSRARLSAGDRAGALEAVRRAASLRPACGWIRAWKGELLRRLGRPKDAARELDAAVRLDPSYEFGFAWRGAARRALGRFGEALADLDRALALDPKYPFAWGEKALALRALGREAEARTADARARALGRESGLAEETARRAQERLEAGDARAALKGFSAAARRDPRAAWIHEGRGAAALSLSRWREAAEAFHQAGALQRGEPRCRLGEARALLGLKRRAAAAAALADVADAARELTSRGRHDEAEALASEVLALDGRRRDALAARAEARRCLGRPAAAVEDHDRLVALSRGAAETRLNRGAARRAAGDYAGALADAEAVLARLPRAPSAWLLKAEALRNLGREAEAGDAAARACALSPRRSWAWTVRAKAARQAGRLEDALRFCARACALDPRDAKAWGWRGDALRALGRGGEAVSALRRAAALAPEVAWPQAVLAEALREAGDVSAAVETWARVLRLDPRNSAAYDVLGAEPPSVAGDPGRAWAYAWRAASRRAAGDEEGAARDEARARELAPPLVSQP